MTLPGSCSYEELLEQVQKLTQETKLLQEETSPGLFSIDVSSDINQNYPSFGEKSVEGQETKGSQPRDTDESLPYAPTRKELSRRSLPACLNAGITIPPGDLKSRLIVWREKNRLLQMSYQQYQRQQELQGQSTREQVHDYNSGERRMVTSKDEPLQRPIEEPSISKPVSTATAGGSSSSFSSSLTSATVFSSYATQPGRRLLTLEVEQNTGTRSSDVHASTQHVNNHPSCDGSSTEKDSHPSSSMQSHGSTHFHESWPIKQESSWMASSMHDELSEPMILSSGTNMSSLSGMEQSHNRLEAKMDVVFSLLSMLGSSSDDSDDREDMSATLLSMSNSVESCIIMRQSGCVPLLIQLIHAPGQNPEIRERASRALYNIVHAKADEKTSKREIRVLRLLEQLRNYCQTLRNSTETKLEFQDESDVHPSNTIAALMKLSFDEAHRHAMCHLGGLYAVAELIEMDHATYGSDNDDQNRITLRRYAGMALTNLTFGDGNNKALLCSFREFMKALVSQLKSPSDDLRQVTASVLRNLSWRADSSSKQILREVGAVVSLMKAAMEGRKESTLKTILSALWNLSAHCRTNKMDICDVGGALAFLVDMLSYNAPSKTLAIIENAGGILRNVSSYVAIREDYRAVLRERGCLQVLLRQLKSPSLTVVSNSCGTLWNLSARCPQDQRLLWDLGAVPMLRSLVHSKHKMISMGSSAALKNLFNACPNPSNLVQMDSTARGLGLPTLPSLSARKQKALEQEIDQNLAETCDNIEPSNSPVHKENKFSFRLDDSFLEVTNRAGKTLNQIRTHSSNQQATTNQAGPSGLKLPLNFPRSESRESMRSITSTQSDTVFEKVNRQARHSMQPPDVQIKQQSSSLHSAVNIDSDIAVTCQSKGIAENKYTLRYMNAIPERLKPGEPLPDLRGLSCTNSTISWSVTPNQDAACSKGLLHSSVEDNLAASNSCDYFSLSSKVLADFDLCTHNSLSSKSKIASTFNDNTNYNLPSKSNKNITSPIGNNSKMDHINLNFSGSMDYNLKYSDQSSITDKQSLSSYTLCPEPQQNKTNNSCSDETYQSYTQSFHSCETSPVFEKISNEDSRLKAQQKISESSQQVFFGANLIAKQNSFQFQPQNDSFSLRTDSLRSTTASVDSILTLEATKSLESDSAIFEEDRDSDQNLNSSKFSLPLENIYAFEPLEKQIKRNKDYVRNNRCEQFLKSEQILKKLNYDKSRITGNNLNHYKTNGNLNKIQNFNDNLISSDQDSHLKQMECLNDQQLQEDGDLSEITHNDYYTVQETYTLEKNIQSDSQNTLINDEISISQTLSYMSVDDDNSLADLVDKNIIESTELKNENQSTVATSNSESCESFNSIEQSEQALLELCIKPGSSKAETLLTAVVSNDVTTKSRDVNDGPCFSVNTERNNESIPRQMEGETTNKCQEEYRRQRDPDAMIASLDRLTATLIQESEAMRERDSSMKVSLLSECTWNEEDSPNEVSFPSISMSAPLVASFKSDLQEQEQNIQSEAQTLTDEQLLNAHQRFSKNSMTESKIIQMEAIKLAEAVANVDANQVSLASLNLDEINPPSAMGSLLSLTASIGLVDSNTADNSGTEKGQPDSLPAMFSSSSMGMKKSLPVGVVARRALSHVQNRTASLENLLNECNNSHLENVKPPSIMDELLDIGDMENSMLSVASITSEIADCKDHELNSLTNSDINFDLIRPVANVLSMTCLRYADTMHGSGCNSLSECLENINPPSLFNEVNQMDESTVESNTRYNDTLCINTELSSEKTTKVHCALDERIEDLANDTDDAITPISSECCSSVESTPKRRFSKTQSGHLTPKQKRQLAKERYKTYTIAAERVKKEQEEMKKQEQANGNSSKENTVSKCLSVSKLTPKQRRQEDRARFQTQILDNSILKTVNNESLESETLKLESSRTEKIDAAVNVLTPAKSGIPMLKKFAATNIKTFKIKRNEKQDQHNKERFRTRTLSTDDINFAACDNNDTQVQERPKPSILAIPQNLVEKNAVIALSSSYAKNITALHEAESTKSSSINKVQDINLLAQEANRNGFEDQSQVTIPEPSPRSNKSPKQNFINVEDNLNDFQDSESENDDISNNEDSSDKEDEEEEEPKVMGPRIVKPGTIRRDLSVESNGTDKSESEPQPKGIRGRRKPLYSKPIVRYLTPQSSPLRQASTGTSGIPPISRSNSSPIVRATRATTLRQNNSAQKVSSLEKRFTNSPSPASSKLRSSIPQKSPGTPSSAYARRQVDYSQKQMDTPVKGLERQGTFTKDEPKMDTVPIVVSASPYRGKPENSAKPAGKVSPKTSPIHVKPKISLRSPIQRTINSTAKLTKTTSAEKISVGSNIPMLTKRASTNLCSPVVKSSSNYQMNSESTIPRKVSLGQRSNSNSSIVSNSSSQVNRRVKETASKIATLWKKVEENKNKQLCYEKPDTRQWITPNARGLNQAQSPCDDENQTCNMYRSSTFEGITKISKDSSRGFISPTV